ncbi:MAG: hypothetical protein V4736_01915 [Bdellovibrionota bacterium]
MRSFLFSFIIGMSSAHAQTSTEVFGQDFNGITSSSVTYSIEPGFRAKYIEIIALSSQFDVTDVEMTNQFQDKLDINNLISLTGNRKTFASGKIDKTGNPSIPGKVRLYIGDNTTVERLKIYLDKTAAAEGAVRVSLLSDDGNTPVNPTIPTPPIVTPTPNPNPTGPIILPNPPTPTPQPMPLPMPRPPVPQPPVPQPPVPQPPMPRPPTAQCSPTRDNGLLNQLEGAIQTLEKAQNIYNNSQSGSSQERQSLQQMSQLRSQIDVMTIDPSLRNFDYRTLEQGMLINQRRYENSYSGTVYEGVTLSVARRLGDHMLGSFVREISCGRPSTKQVIDLAMTYERKYQNSASGSTLDTNYFKVTQMLWNKVVEVNSMELAMTNDFRDAEQRGFAADQAYQRTSSGSLAERAYLQLGQTSFKRSEDLLYLQSRNFSPRDREVLAREYDRMYERSQSGSMVERHAYNMKSILTRR